MKNVLVIESSPRQDISVSKSVTEKFITHIKSKHPNANFVIRDLYKSPLPHVSSDTVQAFFTPSADRSEKLIKSIELSDSLTDELLTADTIVIGAPMWNFNIPSILKAWLDHVVRAGRTFSFGPEGIEGLASGKTAYIVTASGSVFSEGPFKAYDFQEPYLRAVLGFIGITDVKFFRAEGLNNPVAHASITSRVFEEIKEAIN